jgi:uncharacterized membrane protein YbhN (UPF0104 family)
MPAPPADRAGAGAGALRIVRAVVGVLALAALGWALVSNWPQVQLALTTIGPAAVAAAGVAALVGLLSSMLAWRALLVGLGSPIGVGAAARVVFVGQLGKYLPGGAIWAVVAQTELAGDHGVPRRRSATVTLVHTALSLGLGLLLALSSVTALRGSALGWTTWLVVGLAPVALICLSPPVLNPLIALGLRLTRRPALERPLSWRTVAAATAWSLGNWLALAAQVYLLGRGLGATPEFALPALGGFAAAWVCGFLAVFAPGGAGVREAVLTVILAPSLPGGVGAALTIAVWSRALMTLADLGCAVAAWLAGRPGRGRSTGAGDG